MEEPFPVRHFPVSIVCCRVFSKELLTKSGLNLQESNDAKCAGPLACTISKACYWEHVCAAFTLNTFGRYAGVSNGYSLFPTMEWCSGAAAADLVLRKLTLNLFKSCGENGVVQIPGLLALGTTDFPSYMFSKTTTNNVLDWAIHSMKDQIDLINSEDKNPKILVNTFDDLEVDAARAVKKMILNRGRRRQ
nr:crocetin glucosyltransferase, chloroplastic-like [Ipomoea batatas]